MAEDPFNHPGDAVFLLLRVEVGLENGVFDQPQEGDSLRRMVHALRGLDHPARGLQSTEVELGIPQGLQEVRRHQQEVIN